MSKTNALENSVLALILNGTAIADIAENDTTSPASTITLSLHTASPGEAGDMTTNEATYTGYLRQTVTRDSSGWTVSGNSATLTSNVTFPECTAGSNTITHFGVGTGVSDNLMWWGALDASISVSSGVTPILNTTVTITED